MHAIVGFQEIQNLSSLKIFPRVTDTERKRESKAVPRTIPPSILPLTSVYQCHKVQAGIIVFPLFLKPRWSCFKRNLLTIFFGVITYYSKLGSFGIEALRIFPKMLYYITP